MVKNGLVVHVLFDAVSCHKVQVVFMFVCECLCVCVSVCVYVCIPTDFW